MLYYMIYKDVLFALLFLLSSFIIDIDHYFSTLLLERKIYSLLKIYREFQFIEKMTDKWHEKRPLIFHSVEFIFILFVLSFYNKFILAIFLGTLFHVILDLLTVGFYKPKKIFFTTYYLAKALNIRWIYKKFEKI